MVNSYHFNPKSYLTSLVIHIGYWKNKNKKQKIKQTEEPERRKGKERKKGRRGEKDKGEINRWGADI